MVSQLFSWYKLNAGNRTCSSIRNRAAKLTVICIINIKNGCKNKKICLRSKNANNLKSKNYNNNNSKRRWSSRSKWKSFCNSLNAKKTNCLECNQIKSSMRSLLRMKVIADTRRCSLNGTRWMTPRSKTSITFLTLSTNKTTTKKMQKWKKLTRRAVYLSCLILTWKACPHLETNFSLRIRNHK